MFLWCTHTITTLISHTHSSHSSHTHTHTHTHTHLVPSPSCPALCHAQLGLSFPRVARLSCEASMLFFSLSHTDSLPPPHLRLPPASPPPSDSLSRLIYFNYPLYQYALLHFECLLSCVTSPLSWKRRTRSNVLIIPLPRAEHFTFCLIFHKCFLSFSQL